MALVMISGLPCSGRTTRTEELIKEFAQRLAVSDSSAAGPSRPPALRLVHLTNADANVSRDDFTTQLREKPARAAYLSLVMRHLARDAIVLADGGAGLNIKGFRYQLWCAAREVGVRCVSVLCVAGAEACKVRNGRRAVGEERYDATALDEMLMRFEEPNPMTRWDAPLFVLDCNPQSASAAAAGKDNNDDGRETWEPAPLDDIWQAVTQGDVKKAPDVVAPIRATSGNYLSLLESTSQAVLTALQALSASGMMPEMGGRVSLSVRMQHATTMAPQQMALNLPAGKRTPSTATLQRLRRQFVKMHAASSASQNEIGFAMGQENGAVNPDAVQQPSSSAGNFRAQRKAQQQHGVGGKMVAAVRTPEVEIAHRFVAYLEETL